MAELPTGTVTFLFTDIEGSTKLLHELGDRYADVLAEHRRILRDAFTANNGVEVDTQGDAFFVAFARATDAAAAAAEAQGGLADGRVRVRMGIHTGEPIRTDEGYAGMDVHRAARIAAVGHGGQVLVSQTSRDLLDGQIELRDLGAHRLKDLTQAQRIYQLGDADFGPLNSLNRTNLPVTATALVGREQELTELRELVGNGTRLVTVTGAGGSGKTRLALQVAADLSDEFGDGVHFVPLAPVQDPELVMSTIEQAVGLRDVDELRGAQALLVLDNMEHLLEAAGQVSSLLADAPSLKVLTTSRAPLRVSGEYEYALDPLPLEEAVELFLERARAVRRDVGLDDAVSEICRRLDGLPLALELAASRVKVFDPPLLLERLERRLPLLTGGARDAPERQQTLRAAIEWSYELLEDPLKQSLRGLAVFAGSFSLDAAETVTGTDLEHLTALVDWSLVKPIGNGRFFMLETIREYAVELLEFAGEHEALRERHLAYFLDLAIEAEPRLTGPDQAEWFRRLADEQDNLREALEQACATHDAERAQMLSGTIWRFWITRGQIEEADRWYTRALGLGPASAKAHARALFGEAHVREARTDPDLPKHYENVLDALRLSGETRWLILAMTHLAGAYAERGDMARAESMSAEAIALAQEAGDARGEAVTLTNLAYARTIDGDIAGAEQLLQDALRAFRSIDDTYGVALCTSDLAQHAVRRADFDRAAELLAEAIPLSVSLGSVLVTAHSFSSAARIALARGDAESATRLCAVCQAICADRGFDLDQVSLALIQDTKAELKSLLGARFEDEWETGMQLAIDDAVQLALAAID